MLNVQHESLNMTGARLELSPTCSARSASSPRPWSSGSPDGFKPIP